MKKLCYIFILSVLIFSNIQAESSLLENREKLSMELEDVALPMVLNMIAKQYNLNIVLSDEVDGNVTIRLHDVDIKTALETILYPNEYNFYLQDDIIVVKPVKLDAVGELKSKVVTLDFASPQMVYNALVSIKSDKGTVLILNNSTSESSSGSEDFAPNKLFISDFPSIFDQMMTLIEDIDVEERLVSIQVKIIESQIDDNRNFGFNWPTSITTKVGGTSSSESTDESSSGSDYILQHDLNKSNWTWGKLTVSEMSAVLNLLEENGNSKLISDPHITTTENYQAEIKIETVIPIATINRFTEAAATQDIVTFYDEEVGLSILVTPRINGNGKITLEVEPKIEDIIGYTGPAESQKPITISRSVKTKVTVNDGETAALGGLLKEDTYEKTSKVPVLGHIPLLGSLLFTSKTEEKSKTDLIILITPTILK